MVAPESTSSLVGRARKGDSEALFALFDQHIGAITACIRSRLSPAILRKVSVADVMQETRLVAMRKIHEFEDRGEGSVRNWLCRIADLQARAVVSKIAGAAKRNPAREVSRGGRPDTQHFLGSEATPSQMAIAGEAKTRLRRALAELPADYREVLRLLQEQDFTVEMTAQRMERSVAAVRKLYGRALTKLAELMERQVP